MFVLITIVTIIGALFFIIWTLTGEHFCKDTRKNSLFLAGVALFIFTSLILKFVIAVNFLDVILSVVWFGLALAHFASTKNRTVSQ